MLNHAEYVALVLAGLEYVAVHEIVERFGLQTADVQVIGRPPPTDQWAPDGSDTVFPGHAGVGKLRFALPRPLDGPGWLAQHFALASLKCSQCILAFAAAASDVPYGAGECLKWLSLLCERELPAIRRAIDTAFSCRQEGLLHERAQPPTFRASCVRDGQHSYNSMLVSSALGGEVLPPPRGARWAAQGWAYTPVVTRWLAAGRSGTQWDGAGVRAE